MSTNGTHRKKTSSRNTVTGIVALVAILLVVLISAQAVKNNRTETTTTQGSSEASPTAPVPSTLEVRSASGTIVSIGSDSIELDATVRNTDQRITVKVPGDIAIYNATIPTNTDTESGTTIVREEITLTDLTVGDTVSVQTDEDMQNRTTVQAVGVERATFASSK